MKEDNIKDSNEVEDPEQSREDDPMNGQTRKDYTLKTVKGKEMDRMPVSNCQ